MNISLCCSTVFPIIGLTYSWLHLLPALVGFLSVIYLAWTSVTRGRKINLASTMKNFLTTKLGSRSSKKQGRTNWEAIGFCVLFALIIGFVAGRLPKYQIVTEHNVAILAKLDNGEFAYKSDEKPMGDTYRPCEIDRANGIDVDGMLTLGVGFIAERATWQERGTCKSILRPEWGFWFRDSANNFSYRRIE